MNLDYRGQPAHFFIPARYEEAIDRWHPAPTCQPDSSAALAAQVAGIHSRQAAQRADLATGADLHEEGINTARAEHFTRALGLSIAPYVVLRNGFEEDPRLLERTTSTSFHNLGATTTGYFSNTTGIGLVSRANTSFAEGVLVHELTHGAGMIVTAVDTNKRVHHVERAGMGTASNSLDTPVPGNIFEEARAELVAGSYRDQFLPHPQLPVRATGGFILPGKYALRSGSCSQWSVSAFPAIAIELLNNKNPLIVPALLESCTSVQGLRDFARHVDDLKPGLYSYLRQLPAGKKHYVWGLRHVINELYAGRKSVTHSVGQQASHAFFAEKVAAYEAKTGITLERDPDKPGKQRSRLARFVTKHTF